MKKILSFILSMMIVCNIFFGLNCKVSSAQEKVIEIHSQSDLSNIFLGDDATTDNMDGDPIKLKLMNDIIFSSSYFIQRNQYVEMDLNNHTLTGGLIIGSAQGKGKLDIYNGTLKSNDVSESSLSSYASSALQVRPDGELHARNVSFIGGSSTAKNKKGGYGIMNMGTVDLESCIIRSGDSGVEVGALSAFYGTSGSGTIKDCVFIRGAGLISESKFTFTGVYGNNDAYKDGNGNSITSTPLEQNTLIVGSDEGIRGQSFDVKGTYVESEDEVIYSVDVKWGNMTFEYNKGSKGDWDPKTHSYSDAVSSWDYKGSNTVEITNHSNSQINVKLSGEPEATKFNGTSSFVFCSDEALSKPSEDKTIVSAVDLATDAKELKYKAFLKVNGEMNASAEETKIGSVTVEIGN